MFEVLLVRLACMFDSQSNSMICLNGLVLRREALHSASNARFLMDSMFEFAERMNGLDLSDHEIALFCAVVIIAPDRPGLRNSELVLKIHRKLDELLQKAVTANHPDQPGLFAELKKKIPDLRTLNTLHSEKLLAYKMEPRNQPQLQQQPQLATAVTSTTNSLVPPAPGCNYAALLPDHRWPHFGLAPSSNGTHSAGSTTAASPAGSDWSDGSKDCPPAITYSSPRSVSSSVASTSDEGAKSPPRSASASSAKSGYASYTSADSPLDLTQCSKRRSRDHRENGHSSSDESYSTDSPKQTKTGAIMNRRVDSPTDSGIENHSVCSSPRSPPVAHDQHAPSDTIDDMPLLKRALQAPPLINTGLMMDEAYRRHKKFRAARTASPTTTADSLASSHSTLVKTLSQAPRFLDPDQLRASDIIAHSIILSSEKRVAH